MSVKVDRVHEAAYRIAAPFGDGNTVYMYLITGRRLALVDTGTARAPQAVIQPALRSIGIDLSQLDLILNTHASGEAASEPTLRDAEARQLLEDAIRWADGLHEIVARVVKNRPQASKAELTREAYARVAEQIYHIPAGLALGMGMHWAAAITLLAHVEAALEGSYPL